MNRWLTSFREGFKRRKLSSSIAAFAALGFLWTATELLNFAFPSIAAWLQENLLFYRILGAIVFVIVWLLRAYEPWSVDVRLPLTQTTVRVEFGNLFDQGTDIVIAVNEYFDGELGQRVSPTSVHGQFLAKYFTSNAQQFRDRVDPQLSAFNAISSNRTTVPVAAFALGTTIQLPLGANNAYLFALTHTEDFTENAYVDLDEAVTAIKALMVYIHSNGSGRAVSMPLFGSGQSGLNLPPQHLLRLLMLLIMKVGRQSALPNSIRICLHQDCFEKIDLREIARDWRH